VWCRERRVGHSRSGAQWARIRYGSPVSASPMGNHSRPHRLRIPSAHTYCGGLHATGSRKSDPRGRVACFRRHKIPSAMPRIGRGLATRASASKMTASSGQRRSLARQSSGRPCVAQGPHREGGKKAWRPSRAALPVPKATRQTWSSSEAEPCRPVPMGSVTASTESDSPMLDVRP
jgi:hypothetical protein